MPIDHGQAKTIGCLPIDMVYHVQVAVVHYRHHLAQRTRDSFLSVETTIKLMNKLNYEHALQPGERTNMYQM
jgi:hypothetical protein